MCNISIWCNSPFRTVFLVRFLSFLSALSLSLPFALHILSGCRKKLGVDYGQSLEMATWSIMDIVSHFTTTFEPKLITLFFNLLRHNAVDIQSRPLCGQIYPSSTICLSRIQTVQYRIYNIHTYIYIIFMYIILFCILVK